MSLTLIPVKVVAVRANGTPVAGARVRAVLTVGETDDGVVVPSNIEGVTNSSGELTLNLWPNSRGINGSQYRVVIDLAGALYFSGLITVPEVPETAWPVPMGAIINQAPYPAMSAAQAAQQAAQIAAVGAAASAVAAGEFADQALDSAGQAAAIRYATRAAGVAATDVGEYFRVERMGADGFARDTLYRRTSSGPGYVLVGTTVDGSEFDALVEHVDVVQEELDHARLIGDIAAGERLAIQTVAMAGLTEAILNLQL